MHRFIRLRVWVFALGLALAGCQPPAAPPVQRPSTSASAEPATGIARVEALITANYLSGQIRALSRDELEGRGTASAGDEKACEYLIAQMKELGLQPGGERGGWEQFFDVIGIRAVAPDAWVFSKPGMSLSLRQREQFIAVSGTQSVSTAIRDAEIVFVGYGIQAPEYRWDDFKSEDLKGKVLLMMNNDPDWDPALFAGTTRLYYGRWMYKYESAARQGAAGAIIIHTTPSAGYPWQVVQTSWGGEQFELPAGSEPRVQMKAWVTEEGGRQIVALGGYRLDDLVEAARRRDFKPVNLHVKTSLALQNTLRRTRTQNVLGVIPGSDPVLASQAVIFSAHHDHLGIGAPDVKGDRIYNGALDNGAGMATILSIARAAKALDKPPRRSLVFLFPGAEEQGLLGSQHYAAHPTFPAARIAADLNYDGANIWGRSRDLTVLGLGRTSLDSAIRSEAERQGRKATPDQFPDRGFFYRSDHFNLAKVGVPALSMTPGTDFIGKPAGWGRAQIEEWEAKRYHQPSDELDASWNFDGLVEDARLGLRIGLDAANDEQMPEWAAGDEFEAVRKRSLLR